MRRSNTWKHVGLCLSVLSLALFGAAGCDGGGGGDECAVDSCSGHGTCDDASGDIVCTCDAGYAGDVCDACATGYHDDGQGTCVPDAVTCQADSCSGHGACDDTSGAIVCTCDAGYTGAACDACAAGYHDDGAGACVADTTCGANTCSGHGTCDDTTGVLVCTCDAGYAGDSCEVCAAGYHDDGAGACVADGQTCQADSCSLHGLCDDSTGSIVCSCDAGYTGDACEACAAGYHDDGAGACVADTTCGANTCSGHGTCDDTTGALVCTCDAGYTGDFCEGCAAGYHDDGAGACVADTTCGLNTCSGHGTCDDTTGALVCTCDEGYAGDFCEACAADYQDHDGDGTCAPGCNLVDCQPNASCDDASGAAVCACDAGYHDDGAGACVADTACGANSCSGHGACDDSTGAIVCTCDAGYAEPFCATCAAGYHDDGAGACVPDGVTCQADSCNGHGACDDSTGAIVCTCDEGYAQPVCATCAAGYHDDGAGACVPDGVTCQADSCNGHGACDDTTGAIVCTCDAGYAEPLCATCAAGYHDDGAGACVPDGETCLADSCSFHGACDDTTGVIVCSCDEGYAEPVCATCAASHQDNDGDGTCLPTCEALGWTCSGHGQCDDTGGAAECLCDQDYQPDGLGNCVGLGDGETCASPLLLDLGQTSVSGTTVGFADDYVPDCQGNSSAPDVVYTFTIPQAIHLSVQTDGLFDSVLYLRDDCAAADLFCNDDGGPGLGSLLEADLAAGTYYLIVDAYTTNSGAYTLTIDVDCGVGFVYDPVSGDCVDDPCLDPNPCQAPHQTLCVVDLPGFTCECDPGYIPDGGGGCMLDPNPQGEGCADAMNLPVANPGQVSGSTVGAAPDSDSGCAYQSPGPDRVYFVEITEQSILWAQTDGQYDSILHLQSICGDVGSELACDDEGGPASGSLIEVLLDPGTYYLWVDTYGSGVGGAYVLDYAIRPSPCADEEAACPGTPVCVPADDWSSFTCTCPEGTLPYNGDCIDDPCVPQNPCTDENQNQCVPDLPGYVCDCNPGYVPDGSGGCMVDPNPHGEACADALLLPVVPVGSVAGTTADALADSGAGCGGGATGPDRVYAFTLTEEVRFEAQTDGQYDSVMYLQTVCGDLGSEIACDDDYGPNNGSLLLQILQPGSYYLWVDGYGSASGAYILDYTMRPNPCADDELVCAGVPVCQASDDWSSYTCVCPAGTIPWNGDCLDDPCDPNECTLIEHKNRCVVDDPTTPPYAHCECNIGYIPDPGDPDLCVMDPNANEWAFIVFLNADNNLESFGHEDVAEMGVAGSTAYVHIAALFDTASGPGQIIYVTQGGYDVISDEGETDMGAWQTLRDFGVWAVQNYPARHYAFTMWNHGAGWEKGAQPKNPVLKGFSNDDNGSYEGISVANGDYAQALAGITAALGAKLDIVGFDACLMGMWEVAHESAPYVDFLVASEETEPGAGWAYDQFLPGLVADYQMSAVELASSIVDAYYNSGSGNSTLAVTDLNTLDELEVAINALADAMMAHPENKAAIVTIAGATQSFYYSDNKDLQDFAERLVAGASIHQDVKAAAQALIGQLGLTVVYNRNQADYPGANGLAAYLPTSSPSSAYASAMWAAGSRWDDFLTWLNQ